MSVLVTARALQADQEAGTSKSKAVTPSTQQYHPSAAKAWAFATVGAGSPTLVASYNVTSITDSGVGLLTITIATDFSSLNFASLWTFWKGGGGAQFGYEVAHTAGSVEGVVTTTAAVVDPDAWSWVGFGDQ